MLLDSQALLWMLYSPERLSSGAREALASQANELRVSHASIWEISFKTSRGKLPDAGSPVLYILEEMGLRNLKLLPIKLSHILATERLPLHHGDPFDRMLIAQAFAEGIPLASADREFRKYGVKLLW